VTLRARVRKGLLRLLKVSLNPLTRRLARAPFGPFAAVQHVGRRSGQHYETPIMVSPVRGGFVIELTYGPDVDWHRNVLAAGGCTLIWHGQRFVIDQIEPLATDAGRHAFPWPQRLVLIFLQRTHFELMRRAGRPQTA
jgi:deazaflavin-dependent oxidoreductase (nitroreductase family)